VIVIVTDVADRIRNTATPSVAECTFSLIPGVSRSAG